MAPKDLQYFENHYYALNRRLLRLIGLWPYQKRAERLFAVRMSNLALISSILGQICAFTMSEINMAQMIELIPTFLPATCFACCYNNILLNNRTLRQIFDRIRSDWTEVTDQRYVVAMRKYARENKLYTTTIAVMFYVYVAFLMVPSTVRVLLNTAGIIENTQLTLPVRLDFALNNKTYYYFTLCFQVTCIIVVCTIGIAHYSMYISFIEHTYALCSIVVIKLNQPFKKNLSQSNKKHSDEYYWVVGIIRCYNNVTSFVDLINVIYSKTYLVEVSTALLYVIMDYLYLFELFDESGSMSKILTSCIYTVASLFMVYALCYLGQRLLDHNNDIFMKCCQIPFYKLSIETQKVLLLLIMRSMRPCGFSMRNLIVTSNELFARIMKSSFSFATVFYNMR